MSGADSPGNASGIVGPVAFLLRDFGGGGAERSMINLANGLARLVPAVDVVVLQDRGEFRRFVSPQVKVVNLNTRSVGLASALAVPALARYLVRRRPRRLVSTFEAMTIVARSACMLAGRSEALVIRVATTYDREPRPFVRRQLIDRVYRSHRGAFVANSVGSAANLEAAFPHQRDCIHVVPNGVDLDAIQRMSREGPEHGLPPESFLLFVGRLAPAKRVDVLLRAYARMEGPARPDLLILGEGPVRNDLEALVRELGLGAVVHAPGFTVNPYAYMSRARALVLSSDYEGLPSVLIEALACGCPVVSTDCDSGPREILEGGRWGELVPVGDVEALTAGMENALRAPLPAHDLVERARQYSVGGAAAAYERILFPRSVGERKGMVDAAAVG